MADPSTLQVPCSGWDQPATSDWNCQSCTEASDDVVQHMWNLAVQFFFLNTCNRFPGECDQVDRPCIIGCCGSCGVCRRCRMTRYQLTYQPVTEITSVTKNGVEVPETEYRLDNGYLFPKEQGQLWPFPYQNNQLPAGQDDTWSIQYKAGMTPPQLVIDAVKEFACQLIQGANGGECLIPRNIVSIDREGVHMEFRKLEPGAIGLPISDSVLLKYGCEKDETEVYADPFHDGVVLHS